MLGTILTDRQKKLAATALTIVSVVVVAGFSVWVLLLALAFFRFFSGVFLPLAAAAILATLMKPYFNWLQRWLKNPALAVTALFLSIGLPLAFILFYYGALITGEVMALFGELPGWIERTQAHLKENLPVLRNFLEKHDLKARMAEFITGDSARLMGQRLFSTGAAVFSSVTSLLGWAVLPVYFAFLIQAPSVSSRNLEANLPFLKEETRTHVIYLIEEFVDILVCFFRGQLTIALCQGVLYAVGFMIVGLPHGLVLGMVFGLLNIVPYLGNILGLAVVLPLAWFHPAGGMDLLLASGLVFVAVQMIEGYILTPRIMGKSTGLHPMAVIFAMFFWGTALKGIIGMILAIPLTAFLLIVWRLLKREYIKEWI